jgi:hypothetical protein
MSAGRGPYRDVVQINSKLFIYIQLRDTYNDGLGVSLNESGASHTGAGGFQPVYVAQKPREAYFREATNCSSTVPPS